MPEYVEIKLKGYLDTHWANWFSGLTMAHLEGDETLISGTLPDQAALHGLLERIRDLNIILLSVTCGDPTDQDIDQERGR